MRVAAVDIGSNSTRLLIADAPPTGAIKTVVRLSRVTRLGEGVDATGTLNSEAIDRTLAVLADYRKQIDEHDCGADLAVMTSAVRDSANGADFAELVSNRFGLNATILNGEEEARLSFCGAMAFRESIRRSADSAAQQTTARTVVIDIGGGSTELVVGQGTHLSFHASLQAGVVRMTERHLHADPPSAAEVQSLLADARSTYSSGIDSAAIVGVKRGIAVAGTATSAAAMTLELEPYDPEQVEGFELSLPMVDGLLERLSKLAEDQRRQMRGLHPDRAATIIAGMGLLGAAMRAFGLDVVEVSEQDILLGIALKLSGRS